MISKRYNEQMGNYLAKLAREKKPMTNADRIRSMTDYELADWIAKILLYHGKVALNEYHVDCDKRCPLYYCCNDQPTDNIEGWLNLPTEVSE